MRIDVVPQCDGDDVRSEESHSQIEEDEMLGAHGSLGRKSKFDDTSDVDQDTFSQTKLTAANLYQGNNRSRLSAGKSYTPISQHSGRHSSFHEKPAPITGAEAVANLKKTSVLKKMTDKTLMKLSQYQSQVQ